MAGQQYIGTARWGATQAVAYTATAAAVSQGVTKVRVLVTTDAWVTTDGTTPSSTNGTYVPAVAPEYVTVNPGQVVKAVRVTADGTLCVTECV